jgi:NAD-dependent dihydropyrimidine dehydrogenase PreA subunit
MKGESMGIERIDEELCDGCQICVEDCHLDVIRFDRDKGKAYIAYGEDCGVCFQCATGCPKEAISVSSTAPRKLVLPY